MLLVQSSAIVAAEPVGEADRQLEQFGAHLLGAERFATRVDCVVSVGLSGLAHERTLKYRLLVNRPRQFALTRAGGDPGPTVIGNGETIVTHLDELKQYTEQKAPPSLNAYSETLEAMTLLPYGMGHLVTSLLADDPAERFTINSTERKYVGREQIDGIDCYHLRIIEELWDYDVWLTAGPEPKLRRIRPDLSKNLGEEEREAGFSVAITLDFTDWDFDPTLDDSSFTFVPPKGSKKVESFEAQKPDDLLPPMVAAHPLIGKAAPTFQLKGIKEQDDLDLADVAGKQVIVLDFWAIFCPPCIEGLPQLAEVAKEFADKPVVFRAVNLDDSRPAIERFLKEHKLELPVLLDPKAKVAESYRVSGIPQTVLIGKDGRVHAVYEGLAKEFKADLSRDISALLAGEDLAAKALAAAKGDKTTPPVDEADADNASDDE